MSQCYDTAAVLLAVNTVQTDQRETFRCDQITQHTARTDAWQLVFITDDADLAHVMRCLEQMAEQESIDHGKLVDDQEITTQRFLVVLTERVAFQIPLQQ